MPYRRYCRYENVARFLNQQGFSVYGMDHVGHGQSGGERGYTESFSHYCVDFLQFIKHVQLNLLIHQSPVPCYILG